MVLRACVAQRDADKAFAMYEQAAEENLLLNDGCHNLLIKVRDGPFLSIMLVSAVFAAAV